MIVQKVTLFKLEQIAQGQGALTLLANDGTELASETVEFYGNCTKSLANAVKLLLARADIK